MTCKKQAEAQPIDGLAIVKETSTLGKLIIKGVPKEEAKRMIVENHYSHKWNEGGFGKYNFGVFRAEEPDKCLGVAVYGYMKNPAAKIFTHPNPKAWVCELNRMWIDDTLGKNAESVLIAASLKLLRKADPNIVAVQSFADGRLGCGTIYKASNFRYYGFHYTRFLRNKRTEEIIHEQNRYDVVIHLFTLEYRVFDWRFGSAADKNISLHLPALQAFSIHKAGKTLSAI